MNRDPERVGRAQLRVLIADDDAVSRMMIAATIERFGHSVDTAIDGIEAVESARRVAYDAILLDLNMPGFDGFAAAAQIWEFAVDSRIIALTATADDAIRAACRDAGFENVLEKPINTHAVSLLVGDAHPDRVNRTDGRDGGGIDLATLENFRREMIAHLGRSFDEIINEILVRMREQLTKLVDAAESNEREDVRRIAHALKSSSATIGAARMADRLSVIERDALSLDASALRKQAAESLEEMRTVASHVLSLTAASSDPPADQSSF